MFECHLVPTRSARERGERGTAANSHVLFSYRFCVLCIFAIRLGKPRLDMPQQSYYLELECVWRWRLKGIRRKITLLYLLKCVFVVGGTKLIRSGRMHTCALCGKHFRYENIQTIYRFLSLCLFFRLLAAWRIRERINFASTRLVIFTTARVGACVRVSVTHPRALHILECEPEYAKAKFVPAIQFAHIFLRHM